MSSTPDTSAFLGNAEDRLSNETLESVTTLIAGAHAGQGAAWDKIYTLLYKDLHRIARSQVRQQSHRFSRSPTSLVSETWLRLVNANFSVADRSHLVALIARTMRFIVLDEVRRSLAEKRGQGFEVVSLDEAEEPAHGYRLDQLLILDEALNELGKVDARLSQVVEMRYFGGLTESEIAGVLDVTERTVRRDWRKARAFLLSHLNEGDVSPLP